MGYMLVSHKKFKATIKPEDKQFTMRQLLSPISTRRMNAARFRATKRVA